MKSAIEKLNKTKTQEYPKLMFYDDGKNSFVVMFLKLDSGIIVYASDEYYKIGEYSESWDEKLFKEFTGRVILEN